MHRGVRRYEFGIGGKEDAVRRRRLLSSDCLALSRWTGTRSIDGVAHEGVARVSPGERHGYVVTESGIMHALGDNVSKFKKVGAVSPSIFLAQHNMLPWLKANVSLTPVSCYSLFQNSPAYF